MTEKIYSKTLADFMYNEAVALIKETRTYAADDNMIGKYMDYAEGLVLPSILGRQSGYASEAGDWIKKFLADEIGYDLSPYSNIAARWLSLADLLLELDPDKDTSVLDDLQANARGEAIDWQHKMTEAGDYSYSEFFDAQNHFTELGAEYGLLNEFRENGIC